MSKNAFDSYDPAKITNQSNSNVKFLNQKQIIFRSLGFSAFFLIVGAFFYNMLVAVGLNAVGTVIHKTSTYGVFSNFKNFFIPGRISGLLFPLIFYLIILSFTYYFINREDRLRRIADDSSDMDYREGDMRIKQTEELTQEFDIFPDAGAWSKTIHPTMILAHIMLDEHKSPRFDILEKKPVYQRDKHGNIKYSKRGRALIAYDENHQPKYTVQHHSKKMIDNQFGDSLFDSSEIYDKKWRIHYDPHKLLYNPNKRHGKSDEKNVYEKMANDWYFPEFEQQIPGGLYVVTNEPANTFVIAQTRAGKGQTIIEPLIDVWSRMTEKVNMIVNDPKSELACKFYYPLVRRGYSFIQFNLLYPERTNIYNPLLYAADACRHGDMVKTETFVKNISAVLFPEEKGGEKFWTDAPRLVFEELALGMIAYYMEEEREMRQKAYQEHWNTTKLEHQLDVMWGHVTLQNVYQMMNVLASKKTSDPAKMDLGDDNMPDEIDYLTLFFKAMQKLPVNRIRQAAIDRNASVTQMAGSDKTLASVYGISTSALQFFSDTTISRLTSGRPSQNFDMEGLSFPRRLNIQFDMRYIQQMNLKGCYFKMTCYRDPAFNNRYQGKDFEHFGRISPDGWCRSFLKGIFDDPITYVKLDLKVPGKRGSNQDRYLLVKSFYFKFTKHYQHALNGYEYITEPVTGKRIIHGGSLEELVVDPHTHQPTDQIKESDFKVDMVDLDASHLSNEQGKYIKKELKPCIKQYDIAWEEKPKVVDLITPPHKSEYAKIILILISQTFNTQVENSYGAKSNQKPLVNTMSLLDEAGNLKSGNSGIPNLQTMESIGLGQGQYFILILQSLAQLQDVYGDSIDKILESNTSNIIYLRSPDITMLETLSKMSGKQHRSFKSGRTTTVDEMRKHRITSGVQGTTQRSTHVEEIPVISVSQFLNIPKANAITLGHQNPIWATNQTALPYAYALHKNRLCEPGMEDADNRAYSANTLPTTSNTEDFNLIGNIPNFFNMVDKLVLQAREASEVTRLYLERTGLTDEEMRTNRTDDMADNIMDGINLRINTRKENQEKQHEHEVEMFKELAEQNCGAYSEEANHLELQEFKLDGSNANFTNHEFRVERDPVMDLVFNKLMEDLENGDKVLSVSQTLGAIDHSNDEVNEEYEKSRLVGEQYNQDMDKVFVEVNIDESKNLTRTDMLEENNLQTLQDACNKHEGERDLIETLKLDSRLNDLIKVNDDNVILSKPVTLNYKLHPMDKDFETIPADTVLLKIIDSHDMADDQIDKYELTMNFVKVLLTQSTLNSWDFGSTLSGWINDELAAIQN